MEEMKFRPKDIQRSFSELPRNFHFVWKTGRVNLERISLRKFRLSVCKSLSLSLSLSLSFSRFYHKIWERNMIWQKIYILSTLYKNIT